jgi:signal transduction histidine kinase
VEAPDGAADAPAPLGTPPDGAPLAGTPTHTSQTPGEGIGLAIVKRLCELLDATIELETDFGRGSRFRVVLPRYYDAD